MHRKVETSWRPLVSFLLAVAILASGISAWADPTQRLAGPAPSGKPSLQVGSPQGRPSMLAEPHSPITVNEEGLERSLRDQRNRGSGRASGSRTYVALGVLDGDGTAEIEFTESKQRAPTTRGKSSNRGYVVGQGGTTRAADDFLYVDEKKYRR